MFDLTGRVVVVSGASSGLGEQMTYAYAEQGADLVIMARRIEKLEEIAEKLRAKGTKVLCIKCDVTDSEQVNAAAEKAEQEMGKVDVLVNCAGYNIPRGVLDTPDEEWNLILKTDLSSVFFCSRAFGRIMKKNGYGRIINIASMLGMVGSMVLPACTYHATKGGVINFTRSAAAEMGKYGITVNCICPGIFDSELTHERLMRPEILNFTKASTPLQRYAQPGELNAAAVFLASDEASYVTGVILPVDGGTTCI